MADDEIPGSDSDGEGDPIERGRRVFAGSATADVGSRDPSDGTTDGRGHGRLYLGIAIGLALSLLIPGAIVVTEENVVDVLASPHPSVAIDESDTLYLAADDAAYMNRVFSESRHEVAFCGLIIDQDHQPRLEIWLADMLRASPDQVEFISSHCPDGAKEVLIHTHPNGVLGLSEQDRDTMAAESAAIMCVQGGELSTKPGETVANLACYREAQDNPQGVVRIPVRIAAE